MNGHRAHTQAHTSTVQHTCQHRCSTVIYSCSHYRKRTNQRNRGRGVWVGSDQTGGI